LNEKRSTNENEIELEVDAMALKRDT